MAAVTSQKQQSIHLQQQTKNKMGAVILQKQQSIHMQPGLKTNGSCHFVEIAEHPHAARPKTKWRLSFRRKSRASTCSSRLKTKWWLSYRRNSITFQYNQAKIVAVAHLFYFWKQLSNVKRSKNISLKRLCKILVPVRFSFFLKLF